VKRVTKQSHNIPIIISCFLLCFIPLIASASTVLDSMDSVYGWQTEKDDQTTLDVSVTSGHSGKAVKLSYYLPENGWGQINRTLTYQDFLYGRAIRFQMRASGNKNKVIFKLQDSDKDLFRYSLGEIPVDGNWQAYEVPLSSMAIESENSYGDGILGLGYIKKFEFLLEKTSGGSGAIEIDNIQLLSNSEPIQDFEANNGTPGDYFGDKWKNENAFAGDYKMRGTRGMWCHTTDTWGTTKIFLMDSTVDISGATNIFLWVRDTGGDNEFGVCPVDISGSSWTVWSNSYGQTATKNKWTRISLPISTFTAHGVDVSKLERVEICEYYSGYYYFDELGVEYPSDISTEVIDDFDYLISDSGWYSFGGGNSESELSNVDGVSGSAMHIEYDFCDDTWISVQKLATLDLGSYSGIKLWLKQTGVSNYFELKLDDTDGTSYYRKYAYQTFDEWFPAEIKFDDFSQFQYGSDGKLDLSQISKISLCVSYLNSGWGTVAIDDIQLIRGGDFEEEPSGAKLITSVSVNCNPFSPDGDGVRDRATITFELAEVSYVDFRVFDLQGREVVHRGQKCYPGTNSFDWDGSWGSKIAPAGLYFYQLNAQSNASERQEKFTHVLGISP